MPIAVVQVSDKYVGSGVNAPATFAMASTPGAGSTVLVFVCLYHGSNASITAVTVGGQSAVLDIARTAELSDASIWRIQSFSGANGTVSITDSNGFNLYVNAVAVEITGLAADPLEGEATAGTTATTTDPILLTAAGAPSTYPALFVGGFALTTSGTDNGIVTAQGTELYAHQNSTSDLGGAAAYEVLTSAGAGELEWTRTNANGWQAVSAYYLGADGEGPGFGARDLIALAENNSPVSVPLVDESAGAGDAGSVPRLQADGKLHPSVLPAEIVMEWDTPGTYTGIERPDPAVYPLVDYVIIGGSGGGGSGRVSNATTAARAGSAGAGGRYLSRRIATSELPSTFSVTVGEKGVGGAAQTVASSDGTPGTAGGDTTLQLTAVTLTAQGGRFGTGGGTSGGSGGSQLNQSNIGGIGFPFGAGGGAVNTSPTTQIIQYPAADGGAAGGSLLANNTTENAGGSRESSFGHAPPSVGGTPGAKNAANAAAPYQSRPPAGGLGGGGGASKVDEDAGRGGNGFRSGGGGGGAARDGFASGAGGDGADGYVWLRFFR